METRFLPKAKKALADGQLHEAVEYLKKGLKKNSYWETGHRMLGDLYLTKLDHPVYAVVEYQKLKKVTDSFSINDRLRLAWAYSERDFHDKALEEIHDISSEDVPAELTLLDQQYDANQLFERLKENTEDEVAEKNETYFEKYRRQGDEHLRCGNLFDAQSSYEKALEFNSTPDVKVSLAKTYIQRSKFSRATELLKEVLSEDEHDDAKTLLRDLYSRLGIYDVFGGTELLDDQTRKRDDSFDSSTETG